MKPVPLRLAGKKNCRELPCLSTAAPISGTWTMVRRSTSPNPGFSDTLTLKLHDTVSLLMRDRSQYGGFWIRFVAIISDAVVLSIPPLLLTFFIGSHPDLIIPLWCFMTGWIYTAGFHSSSWQATPGKRICGLKIMDYDGKRISFSHATGRYIASYVNWISFGFGWLAVVWTDRRQCPHDFIARTLVIKNTS